MTSSISSNFKISMILIYEFEEYIIYRLNIYIFNLKIDIHKFENHKFEINLMKYIIIK